MQFDDKDLNLDNSGFPLEDDEGGISWEDLMNADNDIDMSNLINNIDEKVQNSKEILQLDSMENLSLDLDTSSIESTINPSLNLDEIKDKDNTAEIQENSEIKVLDSIDKPISLDPIDSFDVDEATNSYVKSLDTSDTDIDLPQNENDYSYEADSAIVDEELLRILSKDTSEETPPAKKEEKEINREMPEIEPDTDLYPNEKKAKREKVITIFVGVTLVCVLIFGVVAAVFSVGRHFTNDDILSEDKKPAISENAEDEMNVNAIEASKKEAKKEEEQKKDRKVVVNLTDSGRPNPFLPARFIGDYDSYSEIPAVPTELSEEEIEEMKETRELLSITVSGIMYDSISPSAILKYNDVEYFVQRGDRINNYIVSNITKDYVTIKNNANVYNAFVGEAFASDEDKDTPIQLKTHSGHRQYVSSKEIEISTK